MIIVIVKFKNFTVITIVIMIGKTYIKTTETHYLTGFLKIIAPRILTGADSPAFNLITAPLK